MDYAETPACAETPSTFKIDRHIKFLEMMYLCLPSGYQLQEVNHVTLAYFVICGLDILGDLDHVDKEATANWILSLQTHSKSREKLHSGKFYGFHGSRSSQFPLNSFEDAPDGGGHLASTYCALAILKIIGFDFSIVDSASILSSMRGLQQVDGSFMPDDTGAETDLRFVFCAAAICFMLGSSSGMDKVRARNYILNCQSYDGGFGLIPGAESHGGATYCAVASLQLMGFLSDSFLPQNKPSSPIDFPLLLDWCLKRQTAAGGFQGRPNKPADTCYAFWTVGVLKIIGFHELIDTQILRLFLFSCQSEYGGMGKAPGDVPDLYHSFYGLAALSLLEEPGLKPIHPELGVTMFLP